LAELFLRFKEKDEILVGAAEVVLLAFDVQIKARLESMWRQVIVVYEVVSLRAVPL